MFAGFVYNKHKSVTNKSIELEHLAKPNQSKAGVLAVEVVVWDIVADRKQQQFTIGRFWSVEW